MARNASSGRHVLHVRPDVCGQHVGSFLGLLVLPIDASRDRDEVQVVAVVHQGVHVRLSAAGLHVVAVGCRSFLVGIDGRVVVAGTDVHMGGHVDEVSGGWSNSRQAVRACQSALWSIRGFHRVNVVVHRAHVVRIALDNTLERGHDLFGALARRSILASTSPTGEDSCPISANSVAASRSSGYFFATSRMAS